jgi:electron transfer flavoprotein beta subunit
LEVILNIVVCVKQTPDTAATLALKDGHVTWGDSPMIVNPWDEYAVEEALRLKEKHGGKVTVLFMGPENAREALKTCLALGCDEAILVSDPALKGSDALATSYALSKAIAKIGNVDMVLTGRQAVDGDTGLVPAQIARQLKWTALTYVSKIAELDPNAKTIKVERMLDEGKQVCAGKLPAVVSVVKGINEPRYPSFMGIRRAGKIAIPAWKAADLGLEAARIGLAGSAVTWPEIRAIPPRAISCQMIAGDTPEEIAVKLVDKLMTEQVI